MTVMSPAAYPPIGATTSAGDLPQMSIHPSISGHGSDCKRMLRNGKKPIEADLTVILGANTDSARIAWVFV
jgi:hypothetical protein